MPLWLHCKYWHYLSDHTSFSEMSPRRTSVLTVGLHCLSEKIPFISYKSKWRSHNVVCVWGGGIAVSSFPAVLICHCNEQAVVHGHRAIIFGYHANTEHQGMSLYWNIPRLQFSGEKKYTLGHVYMCAFVSSNYFMYVSLIFWSCAHIYFYYYNVFPAIQYSQGYNNVWKNAN